MKKSDAAGTPARNEIVSQLRQLLASAHFSKARTQAEFQRLVVTKALKNERLKGKIGFAIIENYSPESHAERAQEFNPRSYLPHILLRADQMCVFAGLRRKWSSTSR